MSYQGFPFIGHFSNPDVRYQGVPTGTAERNNARVMNLAAPIVANFRGPCVSTPTAPCLTDNRFRVEVTWTTAEETGAAQLATLSEDSAVLYFFSESNWEMLIKVLNGCGINERFWVFFAATTDVGFEVTVTDTHTGQTKQYSNPLGHPANAVTDSDAFATCDL